MISISVTIYIFGVYPAHYLVLFLVYHKFPLRVFVEYTKMRKILKWFIST